MANWIPNRIIVSGPDFEIARFRNTMIRPQPDGTVSFDFEGIRPMPAVVAATREDRSEDALAAARNATGYDDWWSWSLGNWSTRSNADGYCELLATETMHACSFDTAWSYPEAFFQEFARQFPRLRAQIFAADPAMDWAVVGDIRGARHTYADVRLSRKLLHLLDEAEPAACLPPTPARELPAGMQALGVEAEVCGIKDSEAAEKRVETLYAASYSGFTELELAAVQLAGDILAFLEWLETLYDVDELPTRQEVESEIENHVIEGAGNLDFLFQDKRFATVVDRNMLYAVARSMKLRPRIGQNPVEVLEDFLESHSEEDMREWMSWAIFRTGQSIDAFDAESLRRSVVESAKTLLQAAQDHIRLSCSAEPAFL
jgi:hypothetical protein